MSWRADTSAAAYFAAGRRRPACPRAVSGSAVRRPPHFPRVSSPASPVRRRWRWLTSHSLSAWEKMPHPTRSPHKSPSNLGGAPTDRTPNIGQRVGVIGRVTHVRAWHSTWFACVALAALLAAYLITSLRLRERCSRAARGTRSMARSRDE